MILHHYSRGGPFITEVAPDYSNVDPGVSTAAKGPSEVQRMLARFGSEGLASAAAVIYGTRHGPHDLATHLRMGSLAFTGGQGCSLSLIAQLQSGAD